MRTYRAAVILAFAFVGVVTARWLLTAGEQPQPAAIAYSDDLVRKLAEDAQRQGQAARGADLFSSPRFACLSCHRVGEQGGAVGPELVGTLKNRSPEQIVESVVWPQRQVEAAYAAINVVTDDGQSHRGYLVGETEAKLTLRDPATCMEMEYDKRHIEERTATGSLMPDRLTDGMSETELLDMFRFLFDLRAGEQTASLVHVEHRPAEFPLDRAPLHPEEWPSWQAEVNRDRLYDFYEKQAEHFRQQTVKPLLLAEFPGLDGGKLGHWGNQTEQTWASDRWAKADLGTLLCGVVHLSGGRDIAKGVCVRLGERGEISACFDPQTLTYAALWSGGFVKLSSVRSGFLDGLQPDGPPLPTPAGDKPQQPFFYRGFYRDGPRVTFAYQIGSDLYLNTPGVADGKFVQNIEKRSKEKPIDWRDKRRANPKPRWPETLTTQGKLGVPGQGSAYAIDTIALPRDNPWGGLLFLGGHDFLPDGSAYVCTMTGDVWHVSGLDAALKDVRWRRFASGLHQALGLVVVDGKPNVLGRDQITRLHDLNNDGEADFYECVSNAQRTSTSGHDYICGLERDAQGAFFTTSSSDGVLRISPDGKTAQSLATGLRNADGLGLMSDGTITAPSSEGDWVPASMICQAGQGEYFGHGGPKNGQVPNLPLAYLPRGLDNSAGGQVQVSGERWGPLAGQLLHFSYGAGAHFLVLRDKSDGVWQGAVVPLVGEFVSGAHRGRFAPHDGQLYVTGMGGWGTYTTDQGCFQRVRHTGGAAQLPIGFHVYENGVAIRFTQPLDKDIAGNAANHFAQAWNYRYSSGYGSPEYSPSHYGTPGHDIVAIASASVLDDGRLFLELPDLQPVSQLHLHMKTGAARPAEMFVTVHKLGPPLTEFPGYRPPRDPAYRKTIAAHPLQVDVKNLTPPPPNPWARPLANARALAIGAGKNLSYEPRVLRASAGETIELTFKNPDAVPHNWVLLRPGALERVGAEVNKSIASPDAAARHYVPKSDDVLIYLDVVPAGGSFQIYFKAPDKAGTYPFLCSFPGHWMVMNGDLIVE